ncbi:hypothetical protein CSAL01_07311 [Colletotrichum salicis]|uniref:Uncharacterized protein n=1 Tax=Colletotrichum salicis TaxID=1209931 RepID=A0A135UHC1_9PEZI|nr:hypothetical protein CSAL01_07311 [Colletotrichum salicis]
MDSLKNEEFADTNYLIGLFLDAATGETPHVGASLAARLTEGTIAVFQDINKSLIDRAKERQDLQSYSISLGRSFDRLRLWSAGIGLTLTETSKLIVTVQHLGLLASTRVTGPLGKTQSPECFTNNVKELRQLIQEAEDEQRDSESSTGSSEYEDDDIIQVTADLEADTRSLMDLDAMLSEPILDTTTGHMRRSLASLESSTYKWEPHVLYSQIISKRFPKANEDLIHSLGKANYERFLRGKEQRDSNLWVQLMFDGQDEPLLLDQIRDSDAASSKFQDSGLGSSIPSSHAETIMSCHGGHLEEISLAVLPSNPDAETASQTSDTSQQDKTPGSEVEEANSDEEIGNADLTNTTESERSAEMSEAINAVINKVTEHDVEATKDLILLMKVWRSDKLSLKELYPRATSILSDAPELAESFKKLVPEAARDWVRTRARRQVGPRKVSNISA